MLLPESTRLKLRGISSQIGGRTPLWTPLYLHHRLLDAYIERQAQKVLELQSAQHCRILDVGCGTMPFRRHFERHDMFISYEGADIPGASADSTVVVDPGTQSIAAAGGSYDLVVSFQVLEHSSQPLTLLAECLRVLRSGGVLFLTLPFMFEYHAVPRDFRRWTHEGICEDLASAGFVDVTAEPVESDLHSLMVMNEAYIARHWGYVATKPLFLALNIAGLVLQRLRTPPSHRLIPLTIGVIARKR
jgi:SAM-dependent methyltransferase